MDKYDLKTTIENICIVLSTALVGAFILIGGLMIGSASAHSNRVEHERQFECIDRGGEMSYIDDGLVCVKDD